MKTYKITIKSAQLDTPDTKAAIKRILEKMVGYKNTEEINNLINRGGVVGERYSKETADSYAKQLRNAGAVVEVEEIETEATEELFRVRLVSIGANKVLVVQAIRELTSLGLKESKNITDELGVVGDKLSLKTASRYKETLEAVGAKVSLESLKSKDPKNDSYLVKGQVRLANREPASGALVRAYDKDLRSEQYLGEAFTLANGGYEIPYTQGQFSRSEKNSADLLLRVFNEVGVELALKTKVEGEPDIFFNSPKKMEINLQLEESAAVKASEYERLEVLLNPALDGATLAELSLQDINFLINETEINEFLAEFPAGANSIHFIVQSAKLSRETNIAAEAFYGWARIGVGLVPDDHTERLTLHLNELLEETDRKLKGALEQAIAKIIIPTWLTEQIDSIFNQLQNLRHQKTQEEKNSWIQRDAKGILIDEASAEPVVGYFVRAEIIDQDGVIDIEGSTTNVRGEFILTYALPPESEISMLSVVLYIKSPNGDELDKHELKLSVEQKEAVTIKITVPVPAEPGEELQLEALPISFSNDLSVFLKENKLTNIAELRKLGTLENIKELPEALRVSDELKQLQAQVDLSLLSTDLKPAEQIKQNQLLIDKGFTNFSTIADMSVEQFASVIGDNGIVSPTVQHAQARYLDFQLANAYLDREVGSVNEVEVLEPDSALSCQCEDCVSALSPGAYLTDLLGYVIRHVKVTDSVNQTKNIDLDFLVDTFHQPLSKLPINCEATKTQLRQVRIACEVLYSDLSSSDLTASVNNEGVKQYRKNAYQALLHNIRTSSFALQRASSKEEVESIASRIGISFEHAQILLDRDIAFNHVPSEETLEELFGLPAFIKQTNGKLLDPLRYLNSEQAPPLLYKWRLAHLKKQWKEIDFPENPLSENIPIIDPDVIGPDDFRHPNEINTAFQLWKTRREWVDEQIARIHSIVVSDPNKPNGLETAIAEISVPTTLDDLIAQQALLANDAKLIEEDQFVQWLTARHLSVEALAELARFASDVRVGKEYNEEEWQAYTNNATNILVNSVKRATYDSWLLEEANINLNMTTFWPSLTEPEQGEWSLFLESEKPLLDPENIEPKELPDGKFGLTARNLWDERRIQLNEKQKQYADILKTKMVDRLDTMMSDAFGLVPDIENINTKLNSLDQTEQADAKAEILALNLNQESFVSLVSASLILNDADQTLSDTILNNLSAALVSAYKLNFLYSDWTTEEANLSYWQSFKARLPKWRVSQSQRQQWQQALKQASTPPLIDPDNISGEVLLEPVIGNFTFDTWRSRTKSIDVELNAIRDRIEQGGNVTDDVIKADAASDLFSEEKYLGIPHKELLALSQLEEQGTAITSRLQQLSLARDAYLFLLEVAKRIEEGSKVLKGTRENMYAILLQLWKVKQFATWREEEKNKLSLSPEFFKYPKQRPIFIMSQDAQKWRTDTRRQREWYRTLNGRIGQQDTLVSSLKTIVSDVEEQTLPLLRNVLINIIDPSSDDLFIKAEKLTKQFLIGMQVSGCQMTTRVSMALEVLQTLVFSIRSGKLDVAGAELTLRSQEFEQEWKWMGSYATWKAAMGVFLYPEQILYPFLRRDKTSLFRTIEKRIKLDVTLKGLCDQATVYSDYMKDLVSIKPLASCDALVRESDEDKCSEKQSKISNLFFVFAQGGHTKKYYWSSLNKYEVDSYTQSFWNTIPIPENVNLDKLIGASSLYTSRTAVTRDIYVFFEAYEKDSDIKKIIYLIFDSDNYRFLSEAHSIEFPGKSYDSVILVQDDGSRPTLIIKSDFRLYLSSLREKKWSHQELKQAKRVNSFVALTKDTQEIHSRPTTNSQSTYFPAIVELYSAQVIRRTSRQELINILVSNNEGEYYSIQFVLRSVIGQRANYYYFYSSIPHHINKNGGRSIPVCSFVKNQETYLSRHTFVLTIFKIGDSSTLVTVEFDSYTYRFKTQKSKVLKDLGENIHFAIPNPYSIYDLTTLAYSSIEIKTPNHSAYTGNFNIDSKLGSSQDLDETATRLISLKGNPEDLPEIVSRDKMDKFTRVYSIQSFHLNNPEITHSFSQIKSHGRHYNYLKEAYLFLPLQIALSLYEKQLYSESLSWFRSIFDFQLSGRARRLTYVLSKEASLVSSSTRLNDWVKEPLDPHSIYRTNKYTLFTIQNIIRCLLDYADSEFTYDTSESVAKARSLYQTALDLIQSELPIQPENKCLALIESHKYTAEDITLQPYYDYLKFKLAEITRTDLLKDTLKQVVAALKDSNNSEQERLSNALKKIQKALGERPAERNFIDIKNSSVQKKMIISRSLLSSASLSMTLANTMTMVPRLANINTSVEIETVDIAEFNEIEIGYTPSLSYEFCIPNNPTAKFLLLRAELNLFKIRNCMNIAGMYRELEPYSAPIDVESALPSMGAGGQINLAGVTRIRPTQYRYSVLVDRAKQLTNLAQQTEASFFSTLQSLGQEKQSLFKARQGVELSKEGVKLQKLRVRESEDGVGLAELQLERTSILSETYAEWSSEDMLDLEKQLLDQYRFQQDAQILSAFANYASHIASLAVTAAAGGATGAAPASAAAAAAIIPVYAGAVSQSVLATSQYQINRLSLSISIALRNREYELQNQLAEQDLEIGNQQIKLANDRLHITKQEQAIAEIQSEQASDTVIFLQEKFDNVELYNWMSGVLQNIFRYYLQQASSMSKLAEVQLAFERQEPLFGVIKGDYYELPNYDSNDAASSSSSIDRRGLTGSARLLRDITKLDQYAFSTDQRKQQLSVNFSLSQLDPFAFQQFKQTGILNFDTSGKLFDRRFPGQYLRLIKQVRVSVVALVPPVQGISATLTSSGISRVVIAGDVFQTVAIRRDPESIAFTNPIGASGVFELNPNPEMLFPFEGNGVDTRWEFRLPKASNPMDFNTIADVLLTIEYTALHNRTYQEQVQRQLDPYISFDRAFSFRQEFSDAWYDLHNPEQTNAPMRVDFETTLADFPSNVNELSITNVLMYIIAEDDLPAKFDNAKLNFTQDGNTSGGVAALPTDGVIRNRGDWISIGGRVPKGKWTLELPNNSIVKQLFKDEKIIDILLVLTCEGELPR